MVLILKSMLYREQLSHQIIKIFQEEKLLICSKFQVLECTPNGRDKTSGEGAIRETQKKATLTNSCKEKV